MAESKTCPKCGAELPENAPAGIFPKCLMQAGLPSEQGGGSSPNLKPTTLASRFVPPEPEELAKYFPQLEILALLGKGGMGAVYKARQPGLDRLVAVKILPPEVGADPAFAERFTREARALAKLSHQNIVSVFDSGLAPSRSARVSDPAETADRRSPASDESSGQPSGSVGDRPRQADGLYYFIMEFMDGTNLRQLIETGGLKPEEALAIVPQICEALQFAHNAGIVHRDIKPENILVDKQGRVKIADFGLAKLLGKAPDEVTLTGTHQAMGTLHYMAPEQMRGAGSVDHRADIYSLGVVFYELLTGELPMGKFAPPSKRVQVDVRLDEIVLRALEQDPEQRYQHASEVKTDMEIISHSPSAAHPEPAKGVAMEPHLVQGPADCLLLAAGIAFVTACGVAIWLISVPAYSSNHFTNSLIRGNLVGMSVGLAIYSVFVGVAGLMLRRLRARLLVLLVTVIVGLFFPAVCALNVAMELRNIPVWPVVIPLWLGMPAGLWVVVRLFRDDVRRAFDAAAQQRIEKTGTNPVPLSSASVWSVLEIVTAAAVAVTFVIAAVKGICELAQRPSPLDVVAVPVAALAAVAAAVLLVVHQFRRPIGSRAALPELFIAILAACAGSLPWTWAFGNIAGWNFWQGAVFASLNFVLALFLLVVGNSRLRTRAIVTLLVGSIGFGLVMWFNVGPVSVIGGDDWFQSNITRKPGLPGMFIAAALGLLAMIAGTLQLRNRMNTEDNAETSPLPEPSNEPRLCRLALWDAILTVLSVLAFLGFLFVGTVVFSHLFVEHYGSTNIPPLGVSIAEWLLVTVSGLAAIGAPLCGAAAISQIQKSNGQLYGLPLARGCVLYAPLLVLGGITGTLTQYTCIEVWTNWPGPAPDLIPGEPPGGPPGGLFTIFAALAALVVIFFVGRAVWRGITSRSGMSAKKETSDEM